MDILPIKSIREEDKPLIGENLFNLAKLSQTGNPVSEGIIVLPPEFKLKTILEHYTFKGREVFEQSLEIIKKEVLKIEVPELLSKTLKGKKINVKVLWLSLLEIWLNEIRSRIWREGFSPNLTKNLSSQSVFFTSKIYASGKAYYDSQNSRVNIETTHGKITIADELNLEEIVRKADKKILIPHYYHWIKDKQSLRDKSLKKIKIVKISPFTPPSFMEIKRGFATTPKKKTALSVDHAIKVFLRIGYEFRIAENIDGIVVEADQGDFDTKVWQLVEACESMKGRPVIYKFPNKTLELIHNNKQLKNEVDVVTFARNKKNLLNAWVAIPYVRSVNEFLQIKRDLATMGISRKGSLKIWLELAVPENLLNIEEYLLGGIDGVILNLDQLASLLGGFEGEHENFFYKKQIGALLKFLDEGLKALHKSRTNIIASGSLAMNDEVLKHLIKNGIWGLSLSSGEILGVNDHLKFFEKRYLELKQ